MPSAQAVKARIVVSCLILSAHVYVATAASAHAEDDARAATVWQPRTRSVAVFKNGLGFFVREGSVTPRDGWCLAKEIPPAKFGTLAVYAARPNEFVDVVGSGPGEIVEFDGFDGPADLDAKHAQLEAARLLNVQLTYRHHGAERTAAGKLVAIGAEFAVLDSEGNSYAVPVKAISKLHVLELPLRIHVAHDAAKEHPSGPTEIGMAYLRDGITWIPEYSLVVRDEQTAELTLRGTLVNEAEDLVHCDVNFVVGVPHFAHTEFLAPLAVGQAIRAIGAAVAPSAVRSQIMSRAAIANNALAADQFANRGAASGGNLAARSDDPDLARALGNLPQLDTAGGSDYTVYTKKDLTVRRGERAIVTLFVKRIDYAHIYRWSPPADTQHFLVLKNDTDSAWTTGSCLAMSHDQPLSEDLLRYTPRGGRCELPVTTSVNIAHAKQEQETDRKFKAHSPAKDVTFDLVTLNGELKLQNFEKRDVEVAITNPVPGRPISASDGGETSVDSERLKLLERAGSIRWTLTIPPGASKVLKYQYERYVPSN